MYAGSALGGDTFQTLLKKKKKHSACVLDQISSCILN